MSWECSVEGCRHLDAQGTCRIAKYGSGLCSSGRFVTRIRGLLGDLGVWKFREYASGALLATLHGKAGRVEVWGGPVHRDEVWFIERGSKAETLVAAGPEVWQDAGLTDAVGRACALAGVQMTIGGMRGR